jgi:imidazolonepropionase-like amidohydrolase
VDEDAHPSAYRPLPRIDTLVRGATVLDGAGARHEGADLLLRDGKVAALGRDLAAPGGAAVIEAAGAWVTPGLIDPHCHLGNFPAPFTNQDLKTLDVNEDTDPNTADVLADHSVTVQDPSFSRALAGGVTTVHVLPGSSNLFGGQPVVLKNVPATTVQGMRFPGAARGLKLSSGENPKRVYGEKGRGPSSRMGSVAAMRQYWLKARAYEQARAADKPADRDLKLDALAAALRGEMKVHIHAYRADDMGAMLEVAAEFGFRIAAFHHATEAYKIPERLAEAGVGAVVWSDWWGFKAEAYDAIRENAAFADAGGVQVCLHSDSWLTGQHLALEAGKAMAAGQKAGLAIAPEQAIAWVTLNPARLLGLDAMIGSLEAGKNADVVIWSGDPLSVYAKAQTVFLDGAVVFDRAAGGRRPLGDFELGQPAAARRP